jgi:vacuolar-type H+-ATPase subunit I/STV1
MKKEKHLEINENNYKGYVELYKKDWMTGDEIKKIFKKILMGGGICLVIPVITMLATSSREITSLILCSEVVAYSGYFFESFRKNSEKTKLQIKEKYPYVDLSLDMNEVINALKEAKVLVYKENYLLLDVKSYEQRLKFEKEIKKELEKQDNNENLDELIKDSEQKIRDNTDSMEEYKDNIKQEKIRLEALKRIREERENQVFYEKTNNIEMPSQEKGLVLRKQKED